MISYLLMRPGEGMWQTVEGCAMAEWSFKSVCVFVFSDNPCSYKLTNGVLL